MEKSNLLLMVMLILILWSLLFAVQGEILQSDTNSLDVMLLGNAKIMAGIYLLLLGILIALLLLPMKMQEKRKVM